MYKELTEAEFISRYTKQFLERMVVQCFKNIEATPSFQNSKAEHFYTIQNIKITQKATGNVEYVFFEIVGEKESSTKLSDIFTLQIKSVGCADTEVPNEILDKITEYKKLKQQYATKI